MARTCASDATSPTRRGGRSEGARMPSSPRTHPFADAIDHLVRYGRANALRMKHRLFTQVGFPIGSGAVESAHRHVLQARMKRAGQRWSLRNARQMAHLRAAYRAGSATNFYGAIQRAHRETLARKPRADGRRQGFRFARQGQRDRIRSST